MVDLVTLGLVFVVVTAIMIRRTSAGVAALALLAGVMLDQLLSQWVIDSLPITTSVLSEYLPVAIKLLITFAPMIAGIVAVKTAKQNRVLSLLTSLVLGFLIMYFGLKILEPLAFINEHARNSGLLHFVGPYLNAIIAASALLSVLEMIMSHQGSGISKKKKHHK